MTETSDKPRSIRSRFEGIGATVFSTMSGTGVATLMLLEAFLFIPTMLTPKRFHELMEQMYITAIKSLGVITVVGLFTGMILALQTGLELRRFSQEVNIGTAVTVVMLREMGPFMTGLIIAASVGSSIGAQIGTMKVSEEIEALEVMAINPVRFLVVPRFVAMLIMLPALTVFGFYVAMLGGWSICHFAIDMTTPAFILRSIESAGGQDIMSGMTKSITFAWLIGTIACHYGMTVTGGAEGVGRSTTQSVVYSLLAVLVANALLTAFFFFL